MGTVGSSEKFVPVFPHAHYHSYAIQDRKMVDINPILKVRAEDITAVCDRLNARSIMDVGSNLGGFLYYLEQFSDRTKLLGIEGDKRFIDECKKVSDRLQSRVQFVQRGIMSAPAPNEPYDAMILQNVYHYIYDKIGSHEPIFRHFADHARSIIWYNPMSKKDPVIGEHANSNPKTDWDKYTRRDIFEAAIKAGFLHPLPDKLSRFGGMGALREHWIFVRDEVKPLHVRTIPLSNVQGEKKEVREHFKSIHSVLLDGVRSYKVFSAGYTHLVQNIISAVQKGVIDTTLCPDLQLIADHDGKIVGYSQPQGMEFVEARKILNTQHLNRLFARQTWKLFSRMLRHDVFNPDIGAHNFVMIPGRTDPMLIDLENFVLDASQGTALSVYRRVPNENEATSAEANLKNHFGDINVKVRGRDPISILWDVLSTSNYLADIDYTEILTKQSS